MLGYTPHVGQKCMRENKILDIPTGFCVPAVACTKASVSKRTLDFAVLECEVTSGTVSEGNLVWYLNGMAISSYNASENVFDLSGDKMSVNLASSYVFGDYRCPPADDITSSECKLPYTLDKVSYI